MEGCQGWRSVEKPKCPKCMLLKFCKWGEERTTELPPERVRDIIRGLSFK